MRGIKAKVTMERTLYVDLPDDAIGAVVALFIIITIDVYHQQGN